MKPELPQLKPADLLATRDNIQEITHVLGNVQRAFIQKDPHDWQYGLEVGARGIATQPLLIAGEELRVSLDLVRHKVRLGKTSWSLKHYAAPEIFNNIQIWLQSRGVEVLLERPKFSAHGRHFDAQQAAQYAEALWWIDVQFRELKTRLRGGLTSPILLYPHHFDLSLTWFPFHDERQLAIGFSTGDTVVAEPYLYFTAYPEPAGFTELKLPPRTHFQVTGFSGAVLPYSALSASDNPDKVLRDYASLFASARPLFG